MGKDGQPFLALLRALLTSGILSPGRAMTRTWCTIPRHTAEHSRVSARRA